MDRRRVVIVGASGSIGRQAREVVARSDILEVVGLAVLRDTGALVEAAGETGCREVAVLDGAARDGLSAAGVPDGVTVHAGPPRCWTPPSRTWCSTRRSARPA